LPIFAYGARAVARVLPENMPAHTVTSTFANTRLSPRTVPFASKAQVSVIASPRRAVFGASTARSRTSVAAVRVEGGREIGARGEQRLGRAARDLLLFEPFSTAARMALHVLVLARSCASRWLGGEVVDLPARVAADVADDAGAPEYVVGQRAAQEVGPRDPARA